MTVEITPTGLSTVSYNFYIIWAAINLCLITPCVYFFFPETKGLSLEAIDQIFIESKNIFQPVWVAKRMLKEGQTHVRNEKEVGGEENGLNGTAEHQEVQKEA